MNTTLNLSLVPFFQTAGLDCTLIQFGPAEGCVVVDEEIGKASGRMVIVQHGAEWGQVTTYTPTRDEVEINLGCHWTRQRALLHIHNSLPGVPLYSDLPVEQVRTLLLRVSAALATNRLRPQALPTTPPPA